MLPTAVYLKENTLSDHQAVEVLMKSADIKNVSLKRTAYADLLISNYQVWAGVRSWLLSHPDPTLIAKEVSFVNRMVLSLSLDLLQLNVVPKQSWDVDCDVKKIADLLGVIYVLRGSTLGGRMIAKLLPRCPELMNLDAFSFYAACGEQPAGHWKVFTQELNAKVVSLNDQVQCANAAKSVFKALGQSMREISKP